MIYYRGKINQAEYISRHAKPIERLPIIEQGEADHLNNLLFMLHTTLIIDHIGIAEIAKSIYNDPTISYIAKLIKNGQTWTPKYAPDNAKQVKKLLPELGINR